MTELVTIERTGTTLQATDIAGNVTSFDVTGWESYITPASFDEPIDATTAGRLSSIRYELRNRIWITRLDGDLDVQESSKTYADIEIGLEDDAAYELPEGEYLCRLEGNFFVNIHIDGRFELTKRPFGPLVFSFPHPAPVTFGFRTMVDYPSHELTVEQTVDGVAAGLSHLPAALKTTGPDRVHRNYRDYPPRLHIGDETEIPDTLREAKPETGIELVVPESLEGLFAGASLSYFTGATVRPTANATPRLYADGTDLDYEFAALPTFSRGSLDFLRRVFFLELMVTWLGSDGLTLVEYEQLCDAGITLESCSDAALAERLAVYADLPEDTVDEILPPWPYRMTIEPTMENAAVLPHVLHDLAAVSIPNDDSAVLSTVDSSNAAVSETDRLTALCERRQITGCVGTEMRPSSFRATPTAYENRLSYLDGRSNPIRVAVVVADGSNEQVGELLCEQYRARNECGSLLVDLQVEPTREELDRTFRQGVQFLHYVGDCADGGLACWDRSLEPTAMTENNVELFVLDAPDATAVGAELVATGSVAGVTRHTALPDHTDSTATETSTPELTGEDGSSAMLGQLLLYGHSLHSATTCSAVLGGVPFESVVGDATHRFVPKWQPSPLYFVRDNDDHIQATLVSFPVDPVGAVWIPELDTGKRLTPALIETDLEASALSSFSDDATNPLYFDGTLYWDEEQKQLVYPIA